MLQPGRIYPATGTNYRYGFNGKENDHSINGQGVDYDYGARIYDARVGKFLSVDPLTRQYPHYTPYQFSGNSPIACVDIDGNESKVVVHWIDGFHGDGSPKIVKTSVSIDKSVKFIELNTHHKPTGRIYAHTEVFYALPDGRFIQGPTLQEQITPNGPKPSANYDYTQNIAPEKQADDMHYLSQNNDATQPFSTAAWWLYAQSKLVKRDASAPDNAQTIDGLEGVNAALIVIGHVNIKGAQGSWIVEKQTWSTFSKEYQAQITGRSGQAFRFNGVNFDGLASDGKTLLDAKGRYEKLLKYGFAQKGLLKEARRQISAANGLQVEWHFAEEGAASAVKNLFQKEGINGIDVYYTPSIKKTP